MSFRVVFFGTPKIAAACLQALLDEKINVVGVVTKPDRPIGRKQIIEKSEVKTLAEKAKLAIFQPERINDVYDQILNLKPDLIIVCAYGKIISERVLNIPQFRCVNVHTSLLPR
jgi:methionyl-tRNA formyltransferase